MCGERGGPKGLDQRQGPPECISAFLRQDGHLLRVRRRDHKFPPTDNGLARIGPALPPAPAHAAPRQAVPRPIHILQQIDAGYFLAIVFVAIAIGAFLKGVTGVGLPIVSVPLMASVLGVEHAIAIMIIPSLAANVSMVWVLRRQATANGELAAFIALGVAGTALGAWLLASVDREVMFVVLAVWVGFYLAMRTLRPRFEISDAAGRKLAPPFGFTAGVCQSATGLSFPVFGPYWQARKVGRERFAFNSAALLTAFSSVQFVSFSTFDLLTPARMAEGALALIPLAIALPLGVKAARRIDAHKFDRLIVAILVVTTAILIYRGLFAG